MPRKSELLGNHNRCWIWGRNLVLTTLRAGLWRPHEVLYSPRCGSEIRAELERWSNHGGGALISLADDALTQKIRAEDHQGLAARMPSFPYVRFEDVTSTQAAPAWLVLDQIQDSFNFGAIIRSAHAFGMSGVVIGTAGQAGVNSQSARSSAGAVNEIPIVRVENLVEAVERLRAENVTIVGASEKAHAAIADVNLSEPTAIIIGNEGRGIRPELAERCNVLARIPITGRVGSLNAAVAAGIICYELARQRHTAAGIPTHGPDTTGTA